MHAQTQPIPINPLTMELNEFYLDGDLAVSRDGHFAAYALQNRTSSDKRTTLLSDSSMGGCTIWVADLRTGNVQALTNGTGSSVMPNWSPDGTKLAFYSDRDGVPKVWVWNRLTGVTRPLTDSPAAPYYSAPQWAPDGNAIVAQFADLACDAKCAVGNNIHPSANVAPESTPGVQVGAAPIVLAYTPAPATPPPGGLDPTFRPFYPGFVGVVNVTGSTAVRRLGPDDSIVRFALSPDGTHVALIHMVGAMAAPVIAPVLDLGVADIRTGNYKVVTRGIRSLYPQPAWSTDGQYIGYITFSLKETVGGGVRKTYAANIVDVVSGSIVKQALDEDPNHHFVPCPRWSASGDSAYVVDRRGLWRYEHGRFMFVAKPDGRLLLDLVPGPDGRITVSNGAASLDVIVRNPATKQQGLERFSSDSHTFVPIAVRNMYLTLTVWGHTGAVALPNGSFAVAAESATHPQELWIVNTSGTLHQLGETNPQLALYAFGKSTVLQWRSERGELLRGGLLLPVTYHPGHRYPLVVFVYDENGSDEVNAFGLAWFNMQLLTSRGYAVLFPDGPFREGYHREDITDDVVSGVEAAVQAGYADKQRVAVMGQSAGGYDVAGIITETTLFKAAIMIDGESDLVSFYLSMDSFGDAIGIDWLERENGAIGTTPWLALDKYIANSPVLHLDRVQTPLLILEGGADDESPSQQSDEMFVGLRRLNKEVTYVRYPGEGHVELDYTPADQEDWWNRIFSWLHRHLY